MHQDAGEIAAAFDLGAVRSLDGPVARGEQGQVWRLETARGAFAVKEAFEPPEEADVARAAAFAEAAAAAGVPTPTAGRTGDGAFLQPAGGATVRVFEWADLGPLDRRLDAAAVGRLLAALHGVRHDAGAPLDPWYAEPVGPTRWRELAAALTARDGPYAAVLERLCDELIALDELVEQPRTLATCHRDLWAENVRRVDGGGLCVIDWDDCGLADPSYELGAVLWEFAGGDAERARRLHAAYVDAGGSGRVERPADFSMLIAQIGHIGEDALATWLDAATTPAERERQVARIAEFVDASLTRGHLDALLAAVD
jgi:Ser/Thr protein kinase RdoA (MazF antagonist)